MSVKPSQSRSVAVAVIVAALFAGVTVIASVYGPEMAEIMRNLERRLAWPP